MMNEIYFGDKDTFAIRYFNNGKEYFCHLVLGGQIIGDSEEPCYLSSWTYSLERLKNRIKDNFNSITHQEFANRTNSEQFELIWKANQLEEDYKPEYVYLPILDNAVWVNCYISIDETTDAYLIAMVEENREIKFLWQGWREPCSEEKIGKLFSVTVDKDFVIKTMENCLDKMTQILNIKILKFKAVLEIIGINPFVFVPEEILQQIFEDAQKSKGQIPVCGTINDKEYTQTLVKYSGEWRLYINTKMLTHSPKRIGEMLDITIAFDPKDRTIEPHPKLTKALDQNTEAKNVFENLAPSTQKEIVRYIAALKSEASVEKNIEKALGFLLGKNRFVGRDKP